MINVLILAGGKGNRIGGNKPLINLGGKSLISHVLEVAKKISNEIIVVLGPDQDIEEFKSLFSKGISFTKDQQRGQGPIDGVYSGLVKLRTEYTLILPCDSPFIKTSVLKYMVKRVEGSDAAVPRWPNGYTEPLHSVYKVSSALKACREAMAEKTSRIFNMIERMEKVVYVSTKEIQQFDSELLTFYNINSIEDLEFAEQILKQVSERINKKSL